MVGHELSVVGEPLNFVAGGEKLFKIYLREIDPILFCLLPLSSWRRIRWHRVVVCSKVRIARSCF